MKLGWMIEVDEVFEEVVLVSFIPICGKGWSSSKLSFLFFFMLGPLSSEVSLPLVGYWTSCLFKLLFRALSFGVRDLLQVLLWDLLGLTFLTGLMVWDILWEALLDPLQDTDLEAWMAIELVEWSLSESARGVAIESASLSDTFWQTFFFSFRPLFRSSLHSSALEPWMVNSSMSRLYNSKNFLSDVVNIP